MATLDVIRSTDGRTLYPCGTWPYPPTNPKAGSPTGGNTVIWNARTRQATLVTPRQNLVNPDLWTPAPRTPSSYVPTVYQKPQPLRAAYLAATTRKTAPPDPCPPVAPGMKALCGK
ncbi:MAG: hypothetical protein LBI05_00425 [Planctomycetaceae bacterium]|nr:hypothetical protein [Planctomycetaceae bacterium]